MGLGTAVSELPAGEWPFGGCATSGTYADVRGGRAIGTRSNPEWAQFARMFDGLCGDEVATVTYLATAPRHPPRLSCRIRITL